MNNNVHGVKMLCRLERRRDIFRLIKQGLSLYRCRYKNLSLKHLPCYPMRFAGYLTFSYFHLPLIRAATRAIIKNYTVRADRKCWNCNGKLEILNFSCPICGVLQHPDPKLTYFEILDLPENFNLDAEDISSRYKGLQMMFHPDKFARKSKEEIDISDHYSKLVNKAYATLKAPLSRGLYILNLNGIVTDGDSVKVNEEFLIEVLDRSEALEKANSESALQEMSQKNQIEIANYLTMASKAFELNDLLLAREALIKMKYIVNIENEIKKKKLLFSVTE